MFRYRLRELVGEERRLHYNKRQIIQSTDTQNKFSLVKKGYIKRYLITNTGSLGIEVIYGPGDVFPLTLLFKKIFGRDINDSPETYYYEAMTDVDICSIDADLLVDKINKNPLLYESLFMECGTRLHSTLNGLESLTLRTSYNRLAHQIVYLAGRFGKETSRGITLAIPLTHQDLANILGLTRETVSGNMIELRKKGLVKTGRHITIPDIDKLVEEAYG